MGKEFLGLMAHWINVKLLGKHNEQWTLKSAIVGFHTIMGGHDSNNLGCYMVGILDHVGIMTHNTSKVSFSHAQTKLEIESDLILAVYHNT